MLFLLLLVFCDLLLFPMFFFVLDIVDVSCCWFSRLLLPEEVHVDLGGLNIWCSVFAGKPEVLHTVQSKR